MTPLLSPDLHSAPTISNLAALLAAPINSYQSVLTLLALPRYASLLTQQPFSSRRSVAHAIISSVLKNETVIETPEDVDGILELCHVLIKDQADVAGTSGGPGDRRGPYYLEREEMAEEQGWVARMVHLFRSDALDVQFEVSRLNSEAIPEKLTYSSLASANRPKTFRNRRRENAVHIPRPYHFWNQIM